MSRWFRFDVDAVRHPKVLALTNEQFRVWVELISYCAEHGTDGQVPTQWFAASRVPDGVRDAIVATGLLDNAAGGFCLHDYLDHQPPAAYWQRASEAGKKAAQARWARRSDPSRSAENEPPDAIRNADRNAIRNATITNTLTTTEGPTNPEGGSTSFARVARDEEWRTLFAAIIDAVGGERPRTRSEQGKYAKAVDDLRRIGATPPEVAERAAEFRRCYSVPLTPPALVRNWGSLAPRRGKRPERYGRSRVIGGAS